MDINRLHSQSKDTLENAPWVLHLFRTYGCG